MADFSKYQKRPIRFLELWSWENWRIKIYGISAEDEFPAASLVSKAKQIAAERLPLPAVTADRYGIGFLIAHEGVEGDYIFVDWWWAQDIVQHHIYGAEKNSGENFKYQNPPGAGFCVWELAVCWFEREAWVKYVLERGEQPDFEAYLSARMNAEV